VRRRRGALEIGLVVLVAALIAGAVIGRGIAETRLRTPDSLTWLRSLRGEVTQVNPETRTAVNRLEVAAPGDPLHVAQDGSILVVTNLRTNSVTVINLATLRLAGERRASGAVKVLLSNRQIYLVDKRAGRIERIDSLTAATMGQPYQTDGPIADAAADSRYIWALNERGRIVGLQWTDGSAAFVERESHDLAGVGRDAVLVAHEPRGVTALDPRGTFSRIGTGEDRTVRDEGGLTPPLLAAEASPTALVPVSVPGSSSVRLVRDDGVVAVNAAAFDCDTPDRPAVYRGMIYLPCRGAGKVVVLDPDGHKVGSDLRTKPGGSPEVVTNAGLLFVNDPDDARGLVVLPDGSVEPIQTHDPQVPAVDPDTRPTALPPGMGVRPTEQPRQPPPTGRPDPGQGPTTRPTGAVTGPGGQTSRPPFGGGPGTGSPSGSPSPGPSGTPTPVPTTPTTAVPTTAVPTTTAPTTQGPRPQDFTPTNATAQTQPNGTVLVSWTAPPIAPVSYQILRSDTSAPVGTAPAGATSTIITGLPPGQSIAFVVVAVTPTGTFPSAPSNAVAAYGQPGGPSLALVVVARAPHAVWVRVTVSVVDNGGSPVTAYDLTVESGGRTLASAMNVPVSQNQYQAQLSCVNMDDICLSGGTVQVSGTLYNAAGAGPITRTPFGINPPDPWQYEGTIMLATTGGKCLDSDLLIRTCASAAGGQFWAIRARGNIYNLGLRRCLSTEGGLHLATSGCTERPRRWDLLGSGNTHRTIRNQESTRCIYVQGDPAADFVPFRDRRPCLFDAQEQLAFFVPSLPIEPPGPNGPSAAVGVAQAAPARSADGPVGVPAVALLLVPAVAGLIRARRRVRA